MSGLDDATAILPNNDNRECHHLCGRQNMTVLCSSAAAESAFVSKILRELNGLDAVQEILKCVSTKVLILTMYDSDHLIRESLEAGAHGYVLKSDAGWYVCRHSASASSPAVSPGELSRGHLGGAIHKRHGSGALRRWNRSRHLI